MPLSLHTLCLPAGSERNLDPEKLGLTLRHRPQLSNFFIFFYGAWGDPIAPMPPAYSAPPSLLEIRKTLRGVSANDDFGLLLQMNQAFDAKGFNLCMDRAVRAPADEQTAKEIKLMEKGAKLALDVAPPELVDIHKLTCKKIEESRREALAKPPPKKSKKSNCNPS